MILGPRFFLILFFIFAIFDPIEIKEIEQKNKKKILFLFDVSSSMDIRDNFSSRQLRSRELSQKGQQEFPSFISVVTWEFDTSLHKEAIKNFDGIRGTDLGACLSSLSLENDLNSYAGIVLFTDGGDEEIEGLPLPHVPLYILGIGSAPSLWNDISISSLAVPSSVEQEARFEIQIEALASFGGEKNFKKKLSSVKAVLQKDLDGKWETIAAKNINLSRQKMNVVFKITAGKELKREKYRIFLENIAGEISFLNNERTFFVDIQKKSLHILYFSRELGSDFKILRSELARDPGITFSSLLRISSERFLLQGQRIAGDESLSSGFPEDKEVLKLYDCIILGSFPYQDWNEKQEQALLQYVEEGGSVVFLGGENSFGLGKYGSSKLSPLFPWQISDSEERLLYGDFPVVWYFHKHKITEGLEEFHTESSSLKSLNQPGPLRHAAISLLDASTTKGKTSVIALQPFGRGQSLGIASNMLWIWARTSENLKSLYGKFWRQAVRNIDKSSDSGQIVSLEWDKNFYRPGETASLKIRAKAAREGAVLLNASITKEKKSQEISLQPSIESNCHSARLFFPEKGEYSIRVVAYQKDKILETYEKKILIEPLLPEGSRLEVKEKFLTSLASKTDGFFMPESQSRLFFSKIRERFLSIKNIKEISLVKETPFFFMILGMLVLEWTIRRSMNLL